MSSEVAASIPLRAPETLRYCIEDVCHGYAWDVEVIAQSNNRLPGAPEGRDPCRRAANWPADLEVARAQAIPRRTEGHGFSAPGDAGALR